MAALNRLPRWQRRLLYGSTAALAATGVAWLLLHYLWGAGAGELPHPGEAWLIRLHGAAAFAALFMAGALAASHIPQGWRMTGLIRRHRWGTRLRGTGLALCGLVAAAAFSGYLLYYFAPESWRAALGWTHAAFGLGWALLMPIHRSLHASG